MKINKASVYNFPLYIAILSVFTLLAIIIHIPPYSLIIKSLTVIVALIPLAILINQPKQRKVIIGFVFYVSIALCILALLFRTLRDILPDPELKVDTSIGYAQYFGYPIYLDTFLFFLLLLLPVIYFFGIRIFSKTKIKRHEK
jgi:hypothetical protein